MKVETLTSIPKEKQVVRCHCTIAKRRDMEYSKTASDTKLVELYLLLSRPAKQVLQKHDFVGRRESGIFSFSACESKIVVAIGIPSAAHALMMWILADVELCNDSDLAGSAKLSKMFWELASVSFSTLLKNSKSAVRNSNGTRGVMETVSEHAWSYPKNVAKWKVVFSSLYLNVMLDNGFWFPLGTQL